MTPSRLPYPWKILVAAAVIAVLIVGVMEARKRWPKNNPAPVLPAESGKSAIYEDTLGRVQEIIAVLVPTVPEVLSPDMRLVDLGIDPLTRVEIAEGLESAYHIQLPTKELDKLETVDDLVRLVLRQQQSGM